VDVGDLWSEKGKRSVKIESIATVCSREGSVKNSLPVIDFLIARQQRTQRCALGRAVFAAPI
jgi:hypothetical protein